ncbi:hypothetical protein, partial [Cyclobacterium plantarum]|uniref:hypothetical protein n=1 Tax=Cyclobacterium plantarum TaxID=2716263 RepID=UPI001C9E730C
RHPPYALVHLNSPCALLQTHRVLFVVQNIAVLYYIAFSAQHVNELFAPHSSNNERMQASDYSP